MNYEQKAKNIAYASIDAIRKIASEKKEMNADSLALEIVQNKKLLNSLFSADRSQTKAVSPASYEDLLEKYEALEKKKNILFRDYEELNDKFNKGKEFHSKAILFLTDYIKSYLDDDTKKNLEFFRRDLKKNLNTDLLSESFFDLKNLILKSEIDAIAKEEEKKSFFKKIKFAKIIGGDSSSSDKEEYLILLRESFREIIDQLSLAVDQSGLKILKELSLDLNKISSMDDFFMLRNKLFNVLNDYFKSINNEREESALFIKEIGKKLEEVESQLISLYLGDTDKIQDSNTRFTTLLEEHLEDLNKNVSISKTLEEVKSAVVSKLNTIKIAIKRKNMEDKKFQEESSEKLQHMQTRMEFFRREMKKATLKAQQMEKEILLDPLTGAYNRRAYDKRVKEEVERFFRYNTVFSMILFDIDHFKNINDTYGHDVGDKCLYEIIQTVTPFLRQSDFLTRYGGEEFILILPETELEGASMVAEKIRKTVEEISFIYKKEKVAITVSLGVTSIISDDSGYDSLFDRLDKAMYKAKNSGRNKVVVSEK